MKTIPCLALLVGLLIPGAHAQNAKRKTSQLWESSVVTLDVTAKDYDQIRPWIKKTRTVQKSGILVAPRQILTTAEQMSDATLIRVQKGGRGQWHVGDLTWIDYHANLALVTSSEEELWTGLKPVALANPVGDTDALQIVRWRSGNLEIRKAEFNQFTVDEAAQTFVPQLQIELSSEIDGAGLAEPVVSGKKVVGLLSSKTSNRFRAIPSSFIHAVLEARKTGKFTGLGYFDFIWQSTVNTATLAHFKLEGEPRGAIVIHPSPKTGRPSALKQHDILLQVDGFDIDIQGDYKDPDYGHLMLENLATRHKWAGDKVHMTVWRDGKAVELDYELPKADFGEQLVPDHAFDREPEYLIAGGLVFQPLGDTYLRSWGPDWRRRSPFRLYYYNNQESTKDRPSLVFLSLVLPDIYNLGYQDFRYLVVNNVNGVKINRLEDLPRGFAQARDGFHQLEFEKGDTLQRLVLDAKELQAATARVLKVYGVAKDHAFASETAAAAKAAAQK